jgi:hypothetical protein
VRRQIAKISAYALISVVAAATIVVAAFYVRLSQGPVSLNFMTEMVQSRINSSITGMAIEIGGVVIERPPGDEIPRLRLRDLVLRDSGGSIIARAPRAAVGLDADQLWRASVVPKTLELIGPRIYIKRNLRGGIQLGFGSSPNDDAAGGAGTGTTGKSDRQAGTEDNIVPDIPGGSLIEVLAGSPKDGATGIGNMEDIRVSGASLTLYDEPNNAIWNAPQADLAFRRMPYGFVVVTTASVANGSQPGSWHMEVSTSYRRESRSFSISARMYDLVPANISEKIFALAQLARVKVPLSGHAEVEITDGGELTKASAEFAAAAGEVGFPDYLAVPVIVDEGSLRADYDPVSGGIAIRDSSLLVGGSRAELTGSVVPQRDADGRLTALKIALSSHNVNIDTQGTVVSPVAIDRVEFSGTARIDVARLDIEDLMIMSGNAGIRLRGAITGGEKSAGLLFSGRVRDLSAELLKKLWPPILATKTRNWINNNVKSGRISDGSFQINLPVDAMAEAKRIRHFPEGSIDLRFQMQDVTTGYFKDLPPLQHASGSAQQRDNDFAVKVDQASIALPSGGKMTVDLGSMVAKDLLAEETQATFNFKTASNVQALLEYLNLPALGLIASSGVDTSKIGGDAALSVSLSIPLIKDIPPDRVIIDGAAKLSNTSLKGALDKVDITNGTFEITMNKGALDASGPAKLNGIDANITWHREPGKGAPQSAKIETTLGEDDRKKMGIDLSDFLEGPIPVAVSIAHLGDKTAPIGISADLSKVAMHIDAISWSRPATAKTTAKLNYFAAGDGGRRVDDMVIDGPGVNIKGAISLKDGGGMKEANLASVMLGEENQFTMKVKPTETGSFVSISGARFDARPLIKSMFGTGKRPGAAAPSKSSMQISANIDRVYANRGEEVAGVSANISTLGGRVQSADVTGTFLSGQPIVLRIVPGDEGRELSIAGRDAGAALRAANLYSKIAGGQLNFRATIAGDAGAAVRKGRLVIRDFDVRNEAALAELDRKGKPKKSGPRRDGISFRQLTLPFTADEKFVRIGDSLIKGPDMGAVFSGLIRKADGAIDITGTIIPAYALNAALGELPLLGSVLTGGKGQGIIGLTFALNGTIEKSNFQVNPVSAIAPGFLRKLFEFQGSGRHPSAATDQPSPNQ